MKFSRVAFLLSFGLLTYSAESRGQIPTETEVLLPELNRTISAPELPESVHQHMIASWEANLFSDEARQQLCPTAPKQRTPSPLSSALSTLQADGSLKLAFLGAAVSVDFKPSSVLIRIAEADKPDNRSGVLIPFLDSTRWVYQAGKAGVDAAITSRFQLPLSICSFLSTRAEASQRFKVSSA